MANTHIEVQTIFFDVSDPEVTKVTITIKHDDPGILLKNKYEKTFPARISVNDILNNHMFRSGEDHYTSW